MTAPEMLGRLHLARHQGRDATDASTDRESLAAVSTGDLVRSRLSSTGQRASRACAGRPRGPRRPRCRPTEPDQPLGDRRRLALPAPAALEGRLDAAEDWSRAPTATVPCGSAGRRPSRRRPARSRRSRRSRGSGPRRRPGGRPSRRTSSAALAWARSTRTCRVRRPRSASQASNVPGDRAEQVAAPLQHVVQLRRRAVTTAPISTSEWPARYLVAVCTTRSAPSVERLLEQGVAKVLSTTTRRRPRARRPRSAAMSATSSAGLVGDSSHSSAASVAGRDDRRRCRSMSTSTAVTRPRASRSASCTSDAVVGSAAARRPSRPGRPGRARWTPRPGRTRTPGASALERAERRPRTPPRSGCRSGRTPRSPPAT